MRFDLFRFDVVGLFSVASKCRSPSSKDLVFAPRFGRGVIKFRGPLGTRGNTRVLGLDLIDVRQCRQRRIDQTSAFNGAH
jgi:hypothetical protein